jgi:diaminopimelate epimerase
MTLPFSKYHGAGNDFIIIDKRELDFSPSPELVAKLCHRQFGIGADGLMLLESAKEVDFKMRYFNSDGNEATMCGNGGRCIAMFAKEIGIINDKTVFVGIDGEHIAEISGSTVRLKMIDVNEISIEDDNYIINTGSLHLVQFVSEVDHIDVNYQGRLIRNSYGKQPEGINANFANFTADGIKIRTYERGVEAETLACGTGAVATSIAANHWFDENKNCYKLYAKGGVLTVCFNRVSVNQYHNVWLTGPTEKVFEGEIEISQ